MFENFRKLTFKNIFLAIALVEFLSFSVFLNPAWNNFIFLGLIVLFLVISLKSLKYGIFIAFIEIIIGSKGYLFYLDIEPRISIRMAFWLILMSVWAMAFLQDLRQKKQPKLSLAFFYSKYSFWFLTLFAFLGWGVLAGFLFDNNFNSVFFDFNNWLYFALVLPIFYSTQKEDWSEVFSFLGAGLFWLACKSFLILYIFSHKIYGLFEPVYDWVRQTGIGEITAMEGDFYRVFFQSHIFALLGFFVFVFWLARILAENQKGRKIFLVGAVIFLAVIFLSYSRSNWVGLLAGLTLSQAIWLKKYGFKIILKINGYLVISAISALILLAVIVKFPIPSSTSRFSIGDFSSRARQISGEAAVSSRWSLLPELWAEIKDKPLVGKGFGSEITYISGDPRILETTVDGRYTTYAFEWGWLDLWLKAGLGAILAYTVLIFKFLKDAFFSEEAMFWAIGVFVASLTVINFFSPYLNHPLGITSIFLLSISLNGARMDKIKNLTN